MPHGCIKLMYYYFPRFLTPGARGWGQLMTTIRRRLHLWMSSVESPESNTELHGIIHHEVTHLSLGLGFVALFAPYKHSHVWLQYYDHFIGSSGDPRQWTHFCLADKITSSAGVVIKQVCCGQRHMIVLTTSGEVFGYGSNVLSQCGGQSSELCDLTQIKNIPQNIQQISCGLDHTLFLTSNGYVWSCGWSADGQTGIGECKTAVTTSTVTLPTHRHGNSPMVTQIFAGGDSSFALTDHGEVYGWGNNEYGQLGMATPTDQVCTPILVDCSKFDGEVVSIATGGAFIGYLTSNGSVYITGYGIEDAARSHDTETGRLLPLSRLCSSRQLYDGSINDKVIYISAGLNYLIASTARSGNFTIWGKINNRENVELYLKRFHIKNYSSGPCELGVLF